MVHIFRNWFVQLMLYLNSFLMLMWEQNYRFKLHESISQDQNLMLLQLVNLPRDLILQ